MAGGGAIPAANGATGGGGLNPQATQAMQQAQAQMDDLLAKETTFSTQMESLKAGINSIKSVGEPGVG